MKLADTSGVATVTWSLGNGENASGPNVTATYAKPGSYVVIETVIDEHGLVSEAARKVTVAPLPRLLGKLFPLG